MLTFQPEGAETCPTKLNTTRPAITTEYIKSPGMVDLYVT